MTSAARAVLVSALTTSWSEADFQYETERAYRMAGWLVWHDRDSRGNRAGLPDLIAVPPAWLVARGMAVHWRELKVRRRRRTDEQQRWGAALQAAGADYAELRPSDYERIRRECGLEDLEAMALAGVGWAARLLVDGQQSIQEKAAGVRRRRWGAPRATSSRPRPQLP